VWFIAPIAGSRKVNAILRGARHFTEPVPKRNEFRAEIALHRSIAMHCGNSREPWQSAPRNQA
jgi:hypothetical protein